MEIVYYIIFAYISWLITMLIFKKTTYHEDFKVYVIILIAFSILDAFLLYIFKMYSFFLWQIVYFSISFISGYFKQKKAGKNFALLQATELGIDENLLMLSLERTLKYYAFSAIIYIICFGISFLYFLNKN